MAVPLMALSGVGGEWGGGSDEVRRGGRRVHVSVPDGAGGFGVQGQNEVRCRKGSWGGADAHVSQAHSHHALHLPTTSCPQLPKVPHTSPRIAYLPLVALLAPVCVQCCTSHICTTAIDRQWRWSIHNLPHFATPPHTHLHVAKHHSMLGGAAYARHRLWRLNLRQPYKLVVLAGLRNVLVRLA